MIISAGRNEIFPFALPMGVGLMDMSINLTRIFSGLDIPVIASGGAGKMEHFKDAFLAGADACLAASIFHFREIEIKALKIYLREQGIEVRL